ncbi:MAG: hypothetical protein JNJ73_19990 [Hyphomonadaceae bacterium]|nr:hypothetical protein [Hyphomonadaceae bacterium]
MPFDVGSPRAQGPQPAGPSAPDHEARLDFVMRLIVLGGALVLYTIWIVSIIRQFVDAMLNWVRAV